MTKALTVFLDSGVEIFRFARYRGGDPETHGVDLAALCDKAIVSSIAQSGGHEDAAPGIGSLAAFALSNITLDAGMHQVAVLQSFPRNFALPEGFDFFYAVTTDPTSPDQRPFVIVAKIGRKASLDEVIRTSIFSGEPKSLVAHFGPKDGDLE